MITLFHISDLHCGKTIAKPMDPDTHVVVNPHQQRLDRLFADLAQAVTSTQGERILVITGDLTDSGEKDQYAEIGGRIAAFRQATRIEVRIVPGNHDVGGGMGTMFDQDCADRFDALAKTLAMKPFFTAQADAELPYVETLGDAQNGQVRLIYLNSCSRKGLGDFAKGALGEPQRARLAAQLKVPFPGPSLLCLHHKPVTPGKPDWAMGLAGDDQAALKACIEQSGVAALLYGHQIETSGEFRSAVAVYHPDRPEACILADADRTVHDQGYCRITVEAGPRVRASWCALPEASWTS